jgi:MYXO-CTERM domain-containing protein
MAYFSMRRAHFCASLLSLAACVAALPAEAAVYHYVDWTEADVASGTASGTITLPDESTVTVDFAAINEDGSPGTLYGAQITPSTNYWSPDLPYISEQVENAPPTTDILQLSGGLNQTYRVTLSEPIKDPMMAIVSLGQGSVRCTYEFDSPFRIVSQGPGYWGGSATSLQGLENNILEGYEGHGTIQFLGTFSAFSWTVPTPETWHGFTFAIRTTERIEPTPSEGGANAGGAANSGGEGGGLPTDGGSTATGEGGSLAGEGGSSPGEGGKPTGAGGASDEPHSEGGAPAGVGGAGDDERAVKGDDAGCNCTVAGAQHGAPFAIAAALLGALWRRSRRARSRGAIP